MVRYCIYILNILIRVLHLHIGRYLNLNDRHLCLFVVLASKYLVHVHIWASFVMSLNTLPWICCFSRDKYDLSAHCILFLAHLSTLSAVRRRPSCVVRKLFYLNIFSSETAHWILTTLHRNDPCVVPYQSCSNYSSWLHK